MSYNVTTSLRSPPFLLLRKEERENYNFFATSDPSSMVSDWSVGETVGEGETTRRIHIRIPAASMADGRQVKKKAQKDPGRKGER